MANKKKNVYRPKSMTEGKKAVIQELLDEYDIQSAEDIQDARDDEPNYRNGTKPKTVRSKYGEFEVDVPQDRNSTFESVVVKKRQKDISGIEEQVIAMYAKGMTTTQISEMIESIYGFEISEDLVSEITDKLMFQIEDWQNR